MAGVGSVVVQRAGGRTVELLIPYEFQGIKFEAISIAPCTLDHTMRWRKGMFEDWFALLVELASDAKTGKLMRADDLRQMRYPDADIVIGHFLDMLPSELKQAVSENYWPTRVEVPAAEESHGHEFEANADQMQPDAGLDIGD